MKGIPARHAVSGAGRIIHHIPWQHLLSQKGGALTTSAMGQMIADLVEAAGVLVPEETSAHTLRHTFARSYLAQYPGDVVGLATLLGHSSLDTTRLYSQPEVSQLATRVEQLEGFCIIPRNGALGFNQVSPSSTSI